MRSHLPKAAGPAPIRQRAIPDFDDDVDEQPTPSDMLARIGMLLAIALGIGLAAQLLAGVPH